MSIKSEMDRSIVGNLCLGKYPRGLAQFPRYVESLPLFLPDSIRVKSNWLDLTMLSYLAILIRSCNRPEASAKLQFESDKKFSFLWRSGFFSASHIGHSGSPFEVVPDIWRRRPEDIDIRANFTPLIVLDVDENHATATQTRGYSVTAKDAANSLLKELEKTLVYNLVERSDLMESREYLHIVLWELVQNAIDHAKATNAIIAAQVFYKGGDDGNKTLTGLRAQHGLEEEHCELSIRKSWLIENREKDYLMLSCVDNGIGIPASICGKKGIKEQHVDAQLLSSSFQRESSDHDTFEHRYAIHGLHLIAQLVSSYQGYLYAQSGKAFFELTQQDTQSSKISDELVLPGTAFQILLPLNAGEPRPYIEPSRSRKTTPTQVNSIYATEELRKQTFLLPPSPEEQQTAVDSLIRTVTKTRGALYLDFVGMPRERHFNSLLLLCVRRKKTDYPVIVLNASDELFTAVRGLRFPESVTTPDTDLQMIDQALATDLTRGESPSSLPLVIAITRLRDTSKSHTNDKLPQPGIAIQWLGIADDGPHGLGQFLSMLLDELFCAEDGVDETVLEELAARVDKSCEDMKTLLRNVQRANTNLVSYSSIKREWSLSFNASSLYFDSVVSLTKRLESEVASLAKFNNPEGAIFFLNWRSEDRYLRNYYQLWNVLRNPELAHIAGTLLLRQAHDDSHIGPQIAKLIALISVTASAGLLARELARILRIPHWEVPSVYDLNDAEWPKDFSNNQVLIVDDLIDTGTASVMVIEELTRRKAKCAGVVSVLASVEGRVARKQKLGGNPILSLMEVELGRPTQEEIRAADTNDKILDVDPHTLVPTKRKLYSAAGKDQPTSKSDLCELSSHGGLRSGHFVYGGHHYYAFFDIVRYMDTREGFEDLMSWFVDSIREWHRRVVAPTGGNSVPIAIIYPYYSPIAAFLHRIQALLQDAFSFPWTIHVACPYQRSKQRVGYRVDSLKANDRFAVFVDDGVASGGTLSEVVDNFVSLHKASESKATYMADSRSGHTPQPSAAILVLPFFDRIGMTPRKHLKSIDRYHGDVQFEFMSKYSLNLRSYYSNNCPLCRIETDIKSVFRTYEHVRQQLEFDLQSIRDLIAPTNITAVATCAPTMAMNILSGDDTATVVHANDALFSDLTSGSDIMRSIRDKNKSSMARLEILLTVMMDPILYRSIHEHQFFFDTINEEFWCGEVSNKYRSYFLMHIPYLYSELSHKIFFEVVPQSLLSKSQPIELQTGEGLKKLTPTQYFDRHPEVFACILTGIWVLRHKNGLPENWDTKWRQVLRDTPYAHQFGCATSLTEKDVARAFAEMLLCNFVTHYSDHHPEALQRRIENLRNLIADGSRTNPIPRHSLVYLQNAIETVRSYYDLAAGLPQISVTNKIISLYDAWLAGDDVAGQELREMLIQHFTPENNIHKATLREQLKDGLAPTTDVVIDSAKKEFEKWLRDEVTKSTPSGTIFDQNPLDVTDFVASLLQNVVTFNNEATGLRVIGNRHFIVHTVAHLLRNAFTSGAWGDTPFSPDRPKFVLTAMKHTDNSRDIIRFAVISAQQLTQAEINRCFRAGGGLMAQKPENERWGGRMGGYPTDDGHTGFFLDLEVIEMNRKGKL